jgi:ABC-type transport system involved in multi-copper enzyme maturation permease subunit
MSFGVTLNPVLARELRARARRRSVPLLVSIFLLVSVGVAAITWWLSARNLREAAQYGADVTGLQLSEVAKVGSQMFEWTVLGLFGLISFIVPGFTAASITGERDRQTLIPMQVTLMRPRQIIFGKMLSSLAYTLFLLVMAVPIVALGYAIGGVALWEVIRAIVGLIVLSLIWAAFAVLASTLVKRTGPAVVLAYASMLVFLVGTLILAVVSRTKGVGVANPFIMFADFTFQRDSFSFDSFRGGPISDVANSVALESISYWLVGTVGFLILAAIALLVATRRISTPARSDR